MTGAFDRLLTATEFVRFDEDLKSLEQNAPSPASTVAPAEAVTRHQERIWLAQQQDQAPVLRHAIAYRIAGKPDIARLLTAFDTLTKTDPELSMRYRFSEDGELLKEPVPDGRGTLEILQAKTRQEAVALVLAHQKAPWISETEAPFKALLIFCGGEVILGLLMHRILEETNCPEEILDNLARAYDNKALMQTSRREPLELDLSRVLAAPVAWLHQEAPGDDGPITAFGTADVTTSLDASLARRFGARLPPALAQDLFGAEQDTLHLLAGIGARFARFVAALGGHETVLAVFPGAPQDQLGDQAEAFAGGNLIPVPVSSRATLAEAEAEVLAQLQKKGGTSPQQADVSPATVPAVHVRWLTDLHRFFSTGSITLERLPLPTHEARRGLDLAVGRGPDGEIVLELVTGQDIRPAGGALLLDLFAGYLRSGILPAISNDLSLADPVPFAPEASADKERDAIQAAILQEFRDALATPDLAASDDFFDFGGHSLVATRIIGRLLHNHCIEVRFNDLFSNPTAAGLARHARFTEGSNKVIGNGNVEVHLAQADDANAPLGFAQMSLWKIYSAFGYGEIFNLPFALDFLDPVDEAIFGEAFLDLMKRHSGLRTLYFETETGDVHQEIVPARKLDAYKWFWRSEESAGVDRNVEAAYRFDLSKELPVRLRFLRDPATGRQTLSFLFHHLALDEWSVNLLMDELATAYSARAGSKAPTWSSQPAPFIDFARKQVREGVADNHLAYWTDMLQDAPRELTLFEDGPQETSQDGSVAGGWVEMQLDHTVSEGLYALAKENGASLFNVVYAVIATSLQKLGELSDLVIGTSASGRTDSDYFDTIGYFTTVVAHRVRFARDASVRELIGSVKDMINGSMPYTDIPIDLVEAALGMTPGKDHLFDVFIQIHARNKLNGSLTGPDGRTIDFRQVDPDKHESHLGLQFEVMEEVIGADRMIRVLMSYQTRRYSMAQVEEIRSCVTGMFEHFSRPDASNRKLAALPRG
ncbi:condensation domain-containing protein [Roseibium suaedae]|uniref:Phosphopantetheine attachment site n=1 Tax=Roseibium suaedae TaxID=735517 RepID=A0A1M7MVI3_9HYPH|nr:condensation domain-containing protein [Roseibium suaedae]SHM95065.1 Phosphopantetheine attachment site [Roseibium suaedae]